TDRRGEQKAMRLVNADTSVEIECFEIENQQRRVFCDDAELLNEFTEGFRHAVTKPRPGSSYLLTIRFQKGGTYKTPVYVQSGELSVCIPPNEKSAPTHLLVFPNGSGSKLTEMI